MSVLFPSLISYETHTADDEDENPTSGYYDDSGDWVPGESETKAFMGSVQPATGKEIDSLPVGREDKGKVKVYSDIVLPVSKEGGGDAGAIVIWDNQRWELIYNAGYQNGIIPHYKYIGQYVGEVE